MRPGGYVWWYVDALSDDGLNGITLIAFIGSVFSPYYAWARRRRGPGAASALDHCALNVALYGRGGKRWCMTERGRDWMKQTPSSLVIGPSALSWDRDVLSIHIDEITMPLPSRLRGVVRLHPLVLSNYSAALDRDGLHTWCAIAPCARVEVEFDRPSLRWSGSGYLDSNAGEAPLEDAFARWDWSRAVVRGETAVLYDVSRRDVGDYSLAMRFNPSGKSEAFAAPRRVELPRSGWRVERATRADAGQHVRIEQSLEDAPFYARSILSTHLLGQSVRAVHESLSLDRFRAPWVQMMLPFRMPRVSG